MYHAENGISEESIKRWWMSKIPGLCKSHFRKFAVKDTSGVKNKQVGKVPYGTGYLTVNRTELAQQVLGGIQYLSE